MTPHDALRQIWIDAGCDASALERIALDGDDPVLPSTYRVGTAALASIGATALAATEIWRERTGRRSEEHTSELQSLMRISYAVFCLKKKKQTLDKQYTHNNIN